MSTNAKVVVYKGHDPPLAVMVARAGGLGEIHRSIYEAQALVQIKAKLGLRAGDLPPAGFEETPEVLMGRSIWPNCMACVVKSEGFPLTITFQEFCGLPDQFVEAWHDAALALNPGWRHVHPTGLHKLMRPKPTE